MDIRYNPYQYVHDVFRSNNYTTIYKWTSKEPLFVPIAYELKDNILWNGKSICHTDTFILLMYFVNKYDVERRQTIREYVKQNMAVDGKKINYVFVVASPLNDTQAINELKAENSQYGDVLISIHDDNYRLITVTILDAFYWVREYCRTLEFVAKIDGDTWTHLGNLLHCLQQIPKKRMYLGLLIRHVNVGTLKCHGFTTLPFDYPEPIVYAYGGGYVVSRDIVPYISIGAKYLGVILPYHEDVVVAEILHKAGIDIYRPSNYIVLKDYRLNMSIPQNLIFLHHLKRISLFKYFYSNLSEIYKTPI